MTAKDCDICCMKITKSKRMLIECTFCNESACKSCYSRYFIDNDSVCCMFCKKIFHNEILQDNFPKSFMNKILDKQVLKIFNREMGLIPKTIKKITLNKYRHETIMIQNNIRTYRNKLDRLFTRLSNRSLDDPRGDEPLNVLINNHRIMLGKLYDDLAAINLECREYKQTEISSYKCPMEECKGLLNNGHCSLCETSVCNDCNVVVNNDAHSCIQDDIDSFTEIRNNSKPCPGCHALTTHISGCNQMWCVICHETWDWTSGEPVTERVHNPMYFEWLKETNQNMREIGDYVSGGLPEYEDLSICHGMSQDILYFSEDIATLEDYTITGLVAERQDNDNFESLREQYVMNTINEKTFKAIIRKRYKRTIMTTDMIILINSYILSMHEIFLRINSSKLCTPENKFEIEKLSMYFANQQENIFKTHSSTDRRRYIHSIVF
jgi:hypothetical protein